MTALAKPSVRPFVNVGICVHKKSFKPQRCIIARGGADLDLSDGPGVAGLIMRDRREIELKEDAFADPSAIAEEEEPREEEQAPLKTKKEKPAKTGLASQYRKCGDAISAGLNKYSSGDYEGALELFQAALELPGNGFYRLDGSVKEYACPSSAEENSCLYNMACCYCQMGKPQAAMTCLEALLENDFEDFNTIRTDPDLAALQGRELDALISKYDGILAKLFNKKKDETLPKKPWISPW